MTIEETRVQGTDPSAEALVKEPHDDSLERDARRLGDAGPRRFAAPVARATTAVPPPRSNYVTRFGRNERVQDTPPGVAEGQTAQTGTASEKSFTSVLYDAITNAFASKNPTQMFCLSWPGTVIDHERVEWALEDAIAGNMPEASLARSSQILDIYVPPSPITQPDGTRVSDRYAQALSQLGPKPNKHLLALQQIVRDRLQTKIQVSIKGETKEVTLLDWFSILQGEWEQTKRAWAELQQKMRAEFQSRFPGNAKAWWNEYLVWYETNAQGHIDAINAAYDRLLSEFPLTAWQDAIAILDTSDNAGLTNAKRIMRTATLPLPYQEGSAYTPTTGVPYNWPQQLRPNTSFIDMLADPQVQADVLDSAIRQLEQELLMWRAIVPQVDDDAIMDATNAFDAAISAYRTKNANLRGQLNENALLAVNTFVDIAAAQGKYLPDIPVDEQAGVVANVNNLGNALDSTFSNVDWAKISDAATAISDANGGLIKRQQELVDSGMQLANAASRLLAQEATNIQFPWLPTYISQLTNKLTALQEQARNAASASNNYYRYLQAVPADDTSPNPATSNAFASNAGTSKLDSPENKSWMELQIIVTAKEMKTSSSMSTNFEDTQWGLDLFLGGVSGESANSATSFASSFMSDESQIQISCLALKVLINRPWMKPEIFAHTSSMFRTLEKKLSPLTQTTSKDILSSEANLLSLINDHSFPAYPVALLLVKDVSIKVKIDQSKSSVIRQTEKSVKSEGGGFLCFSVSKSESSESNIEAMSSYTMGGQMVARAPSPQVLGYWVQFLPPDESEEIDEDVAIAISDALGFVSALKEAHSSERLVKTTPRPAGQVTSSDL